MAALMYNLDDIRLLFENDLADSSNSLTRACSFSWLPNPVRGANLFIRRNVN